MLKQIIICALLASFVLSQTFPAIDANGGLQINWQGLDIDDTKFTSLMAEFQTTYAVQSLKYLNFHLELNRLTNLNSLSFLSNYKNIIEYSLFLGDNKNLQSVNGALSVSENNIQSVQFDFQNCFQINDIPTFATNLKNIKYTKTFTLNFMGAALSQTQHDALIQQIGKQLYFNLERLEINLQGAQLENIQNWKYMSGFTSLLILKLDYQFIPTLGDIQEIFKMVESYTTLTNFTFYQTCTNFNYFSQVSSLTSLDLLELGIQNIGQSDHDKLVSDLAYLNNLGTLTLVFDSHNLTNTQGLSKLKSLSYLTRFGITYKNSLIVDISGLSVVEKFKSLKEFRLAIQEPDVSGISGIDFLSGLKFTLFDVVIESNKLPKNYFQTVFTLTALKELYLKIVDMSQTDSTILNGLDNMAQLTVLGLNIDDTNILDISSLNFTKFVNLLRIDLSFGDNVMKNYNNLAGLAAAQNIMAIQISGSFSNYSFLEPYNNLTKLQVLATMPYRQCSLSNSFIAIFEQGASWDCRQCNEECLKCYGPQFSNCLTCATTYWFQYQCLETCPHGYHPNQTTHRCDPDSVQKFLQW